jgi:hypothetical protein
MSKHKYWNQNTYRPTQNTSLPAPPIVVIDENPEPPPEAAETKVLPRNPYHTEEKSFTTRPGGPDMAILMSEYINRYAIGTGAVLLQVHPIPGNNSFLFIWENP